MLKKINKRGLSRRNLMHLCVSVCACPVPMHKGLCSDSKCVCACVKMFVCALTLTKVYSSPTCIILFYSITKNLTDPRSTLVEKPISFPIQHPKPSFFFFYIHFFSYLSTTSMEEFYRQRTTQCSKHQTI